MRAIDGDKLLQTGGFFHDIDDCEYWTKEDIDNAPTIDPSSLVKRGRWEKIDASYWSWKPDGARPVTRFKYRHNECGKVVSKEENYCPNCGARMQED